MITKDMTHVAVTCSAEFAEASRQAQGSHDRYTAALDKIAVELVDALGADVANHLQARLSAAINERSRAG